MAFVKVYAGGQERTVFLGDAPLVLGRDANCDVPVADPKVSRLHCVLEPLGGGRWRVRDLGSGNGTRVNGETVEARELSREDVVEIGDAKVLFAGEAASVVAEGPGEPVRRRTAPRRRPTVAYWLGGLGLLLGGVVLVLVMQGLRGKGGPSLDEEKHFRSVMEARADADRLKFAEMFLASYPRSAHVADVRKVADTARERLRGAPIGGYDPRTELQGLRPAEAVARLEKMLVEVPDDRRPAVRLALEEKRAELEAAREAFFAEREAEFRQQVVAGEYARAREIWFFLRGEPEWEPIPPEYGSRIVRANEDLGSAAAADRTRLLEEEARFEAAHEFARAVALLEQALPRFKGTAVERSLRERCETARLARKAGASGASAPAQSLVRVDVGKKMGALLARLPERDFDAAAAGLRGLAEEAKKQSDPGFREIDARARECEALAAIQAATVAALAKGDLPKGQVRKRWRVLAGGPDGVKVSSKGEEQDFAWGALPADLHLALLEAHEPSVAQGSLGLAVAAQALGSPPDMIAALTRAYADDSSRPAIDSFVAARVRKEALPEGGYVIHEGELLLRREFLRREEEQQIAALQLQLAKSYEAIRADASLAKLERLASRKDELDKARAFALELIFDDVKYFYPYRGVGRDGEYQKAQQEVDRRVRAVEEIWEDKLVVSVRATAELERALKQFDEAALGLRRCLVDVDEKVSDVEFLRSYVGQKFELLTYYRSPGERELLSYTREVMEWNPTVEGKITEVEREQVRVTNLYRIMFGRQPVRIVEKLVLSSRGHCEEMSKIGYFGHFSPTPGRKTPWDRMKLQGYDFGVSENCIQGQTSPMGAHLGWCHSSGHHRNILMAPWTEMGTGHYGGLMTQNYGQAPKWSKETREETVPAEVEEEGAAGEEEGVIPDEEVLDYEEGD
jgi:hypothetical protein